MRLLVAAVAAAALIACAGAAPPDGGDNKRTVPPGAHLRTDGVTFRTPDGQVFHWRGITAFRLLEYTAHGQEADAEAFLAWAASRDLTVVRVLAMGAGWMSLSPSDGRAALPRLLDLAARHGLYVEIVALAGSADIAVDPAEQVAAIGRIAAAHANAVLELANEPTHPTQAREVHEPQALARFASAIRNVPVALGADEGEGFAAGDYVTWHVPRDVRFDGWGHVLEIARGAEMLRRWKKPLVSDEPIGAGPIYDAGRRDTDPARFRAAGLLTRLAGLGATFHYEAGLHARVPTGRELECFNAWNEAWTVLPDDIETSGVFHRAGDGGAAVASFDSGAALAVFERQRADTAWVIAVGVRGDPGLKWAPGWQPSEVRRSDRLQVLRARKAK
ncbi:MAG: hypothetical protein A3H96_15175 [Acidobacteria bacterium RIFCSPLOWO2_02_FULL_67_36]|nr:MAG: hypothetical protein A3H96_15175 [Acidobacteria bacterium RIFCSPLOWO2_02_FULL_67_36]OFW19320.1 MAG: hypothetical protein A3G21_02380 [Acidobacteria bacterium RIFCSPLOWO2_12_FULL_66_21]